MKKFRRIGAIVVIALLLSMYIICFIAAVQGSENAKTVFKAALGLTVALPIVLYAFLLMLRLAQGKKQETTPDGDVPEPDEDVPEEEDQG
ncbi:MAG: hypothetical protein II882_08720 [Lachnospiraceae bacterium]|nr:hypothetical protein [Lachnospiraceae bacterium]